MFSAEGSFDLILETVFGCLCEALVLALVSLCSIFHLTDLHNSQNMKIFHLDSTDRTLLGPPRAFVSKIYDI